MSWPCSKCCRAAVTQCALCTFDRKLATVEVDLGVGGWVDGDCDFCDQVAGQFTADTSAPLFICTWEYHNPTEGICGAVDGTLRITVFIKNTAPSWQWHVDVDLSPTGLPIQSRADYESTGSTSTDCFALGGDGSTDKLTLTKISESHIGPPPNLCSGALPNFIEIWAP